MPSLGADSAKPFTASEYFEAGIGPSMRAPTAELRKLQRQKRLEIGQTSLAISHFPPAPTLQDSPANETRQAVTTAPVQPPSDAFDCLRCNKEIYPVTRCACGTAKERQTLWKTADDQCFKDDRRGWFEAKAPPQRAYSDPPGLWEELAQSVLREEAERETRKKERAARVAAARAPFRIAAGEAAAIAMKRMIAQERSDGEQTREMVHSP
ncbi:hypothetical protein B0H19DRAFT_1074696 [Mycena capillaripes]|nr:hypothetical protein B0H19DRAFT_1074696 [Mycena capillaripes]